MAALYYAVADLPDRPLDAAAHFYSQALPVIRARLANAGEVVIEFQPADHTHRAWRLAAVQELAREAAPARVNGIVGGDAPARDTVCEFLGRSPGVTGQLLTVDGKSGEID